MERTPARKRNESELIKAFFSPRSIAVIGASRSEGKLGHALLSSIIQSGFQGAIYPINPGTDEILSLPCYPNLDAVEGEIDLAVIVIHAKLVLDVLEACGKRGVGSVIIITAGFREVGHEGLLAERKMAELANNYGVRILRSKLSRNDRYSGACKRLFCSRDAAAWQDRFHVSVRGPLYLYLGYCAGRGCGIFTAILQPSMTQF